MQNNLNNLIKRGLAINQNKLNVSSPGVDLLFMNKVENILDIVIPNDMKEISKQISCDLLGCFDFFDFTVDSDNWGGIIKNNLELRKEYSEHSEGESDMSRILVLADDDGGSVFMITQDSPDKPTPVIWCDYGDMYYYSIHKKFQHPHDEWPSFTAFFEYLIEQEEKALEAGKE